MTTITHNITINAPAWRVWRALTTTKIAQKWTGCTITSTWELGASVSYIFYDEQGNISKSDVGEMSWTGTISTFDVNSHYTITYPENAPHGVVSEDYVLDEITPWSTVLTFSSTYTSEKITESYADGVDGLFATLKKLVEETPVIKVTTLIPADMHTIWNCWTKPEHITKWNFASDDWECPKAENDVRIGGTFSSTMSAKDGSASFDFGGVYTDVKEYKKLEYVLVDDRLIQVFFNQVDDKVEVTELFDAEHENSLERQESGWQSILDNFKHYVETLIN